MSKKRDRTIFRRPEDGKWADKRDDASHPAGVYDTQEDAIDSAREHLKQQGGGELKVKGRDGRIRKKDTISPGNDPFPPKG